MEAFEGTNWGPVKSVFVILDEYVGFDKNKNPVDFNEISIENGEKFEKIPFSIETASFSEQEKNDNGNYYFEKNVMLTIPKLRAEVNELLEPYQGRKLALLVIDMNDTGHLVNPLRMYRHRTIPGQVGSLNATRVEFTGKSVYESPIVTGTGDASPLI